MDNVVNCFQILYIRSLNTICLLNSNQPPQLWIAFRFCIFVLWTQWIINNKIVLACCELLSDFVYSFFEHNQTTQQQRQEPVVNCFQILYIRSLNTIGVRSGVIVVELWIAFRFCIFVLWTQCNQQTRVLTCGCELLSDFVYSFFEHNAQRLWRAYQIVVNCFQILYIRSLNTMLKGSDEPIK